MKDELILYLKTYKKSTITLSELENLFSGGVTYKELAESIKELIEEDILTEKNTKNKNGKEISLAYKFGINKFNLNKDHIGKIQKVALQISKCIDLQNYYKLSDEIWNKDLPYIYKVNEYIKFGLLGIDFKTAEEVSFDISGDEKWIGEKGGKTLLQNIKLWEKLKINHSNDPLMMAVNPNQFSRKTYAHLIVENKATFLALMDFLKETTFTSLIFGSGWKIVSNIILLEKQLNIKGEHVLYYFGDLDYEGISIWNSINEKKSAILAADFYCGMLKKNSSKGKENQQKNTNALNNFLKCFKSEEQDSIKNILENGRYLPQEALNKEALQSIWRNIKWI